MISDGRNRRRLGEKIREAGAGPKSEVTLGAEDDAGSYLLLVAFSGYDDSCPSNTCRAGNCVPWRQGPLGTW